MYVSASLGYCRNVTEITEKFKRKDHKQMTSKHGKAPVNVVKGKYSELSVL